ncbi:hypothetical protein EDB81DRAFT_763349 [Dactylonectria macrodidyma]|uniref:Uncharacterized protein n=1 Tax=Dactylonectria macrodidyma TaxID=307937 RepID=A0A9P9IUH2_9HYPO|nr:hypothetical protein EDB81DRAFT_763349 [Dactylonectria macrodidyma]
MNEQRQNLTECDFLIPQKQPEQKEKHSSVANRLLRDPWFVIAAVLNIFCISIYVISPLLVKQLDLAGRDRRFYSLGVTTAIGRVQESLCSLLSITIEPYATVALSCETDPEKRQSIRKSDSVSIIIKGSSKIMGDFLLILTLEMPLLVTVMLIIACFALISTYMYLARGVNEMAQTWKRHRDDTVENRPTHVEDTNMDSEAGWEKYLKQREANRHVFTAITLTVAFVFVFVETRVYP